MRDKAMKAIRDLDDFGTITCPACEYGFQWECDMAEDEIKYCPSCGQHIEVKDYRRNKA